VLSPEILLAKKKGALEPGFLGFQTDSSRVGCFGSMGFGGHDNSTTVY